MWVVASTYGSGTYNSSTYNGSTTSSSGGGSSGGGSAGGNTAGTPLLTNTGFDIALIVGLASVLVLAAIVVRIWKRPAKQA